MVLSILTELIPSNHSNQGQKKELIKIEMNLFDMISRFEVFGWVMKTYLDRHGKLSGIKEEFSPQDIQ